MSLKDNSCPVCGEGSQAVLFEAPEFLLARRTYTVFRCVGCGHSHIGPVPSVEQLAQYYAEIVPHIRTIHGTNSDGAAGLVTAVEKEKVCLIQSTESLPGHGAVLDIGFGTGGFLVGMAQQGWSCTGIEVGDVGDAEPPWVGLLDAHYGLRALDSLPGDSFDLITMWHVLEHLPDPIDVLLRARRLLRVNGMVVLAVPNMDGLSARIMGRYWYAIAPPWHLHHFTPRSLHRVFARAGLAVQRIDGFGAQAMYLMWVESLTNAIDRCSGRRFGWALSTGLRIVRGMIAAAPGAVQGAERRSGRPGAVVVMGRRNLILESAHSPERDTSSSG